MKQQGEITDSQKFFLNEGYLYIKLNFNSKTVIFG